MTGHHLNILNGLGILSGLDRYEGDLLKGSDDRLILQGALDLVDGGGEGLSEDMLIELGIQDGIEGLSQELRGRGGFLRQRLHGATFDRMTENLLFDDHGRRGALGALFNIGAEGVKRISAEVALSVLNDAVSGKKGRLTTLKESLEAVSDGSPYDPIIDAFVDGRIPGVAISIGSSDAVGSSADVLRDAGYISVNDGLSERANLDFLGIDDGLGRMEGMGDAFRFSLELSEAAGGPDRIRIVMVTDDPAIAMASSSMGFATVHSPDGLTEVEEAFLLGCAKDILGGRVVREASELLTDEGSKPSLENLISDALLGSRIVTEIALMRLDAMGSRNDILHYPETGYGLPTFTAWRGETEITVAYGAELLRTMLEDLAESGGLEEALQAGEVAMYACELIEALRYLQRPELYSQEGRGFIPDRVLRELGLSFVDDSIPGCALMMGRPAGGDFIRAMVRDCQNKGMLVIVADEAERMLRESGVKTGWDRMLYPVGDCTSIVHAVNFALRAALSFGNVAPGDRGRLSAYLEKRPKVVVLHMGPLDPIRSALAFAAIMHKAVIVSDHPVPEVPDLLEMRKEPVSMVQKAMEMRGIMVQSSGVDVPVAYGPAFEGEVIRKPDSRIEMGGGRSVSFELLVNRDEDEVKDGTVTLVGDDLDALPAGGTSPFALLIEVYGKRMEPDFEAVLERRVHQFLNYAEGLWHTGQRDLNWIRVSNEAYDAGLRLTHIGDVLVDRLKNEFGGIISRVQVTIVTDGQEVDRILEEARSVYRERDDRMAGLKDSSVDVFYTCTLCQSFAPDHVCIISPERLGLCGAINWLDAKASNRISSHGPNQPIDKGRPIDEAKGEWEGLNDIVSGLSNSKVERVCMYSLMDAPMTSCGCFEAIVAMSSDMQSVVIVDREYTGMTPVGMRFSTLAGSIGGGRQTPGFMGIGRKYITSDKFLAAEGGLARVAWMPKGLKERLGDEIRALSLQIGEPDLLEKIADETVCEDAAGLLEWMQKVGHPALGMPPLL